MASDYTPQKFSIQQVFEVLLRDPADNSIIAYLDDLKTSSLMNEAALVYPTGGRGNVYIGGAFTHSRRAKIEIKKATWNTQLIAQQIGTTVVTGANTDAVKYDVLTIDSDAAVTTFTALGTAGSEIEFAYVLNTDGSFASTLTQDAAATPTKFSYTPGTKTIATSGLADDTRIAVAYKFTTGTSAQTITIEADSVPSTALVTAYGLVQDLCDGSLYQMQINGTAQIDPNWNFELDGAGDPSVENFNLEFVKGCLNDELVEIIVYNESDAS